MELLEINSAHRRKMESRSIDNERRAQWFIFLLALLALVAIFIIFWFAYSLFLLDKSRGATIIAVVAVIAILSVVSVIEYAKIKRWLRPSASHLDNGEDDEKH